MPSLLKFKPRINPYFYVYYSHITTSLYLCFFGKKISFTERYRDKKYFKKIIRIIKKFNGKNSLEMISKKNQFSTVLNINSILTSKDIFNEKFKTKALFDFYKNHRYYLNKSSKEDNKNKVFIYLNKRDWSLYIFPKNNKLHKGVCKKCLIKRIHENKFSPITIQKPQINKALEKKIVNKIYKVIPEIISKISFKNNYVYEINLFESIKINKLYLVKKNNCPKCNLSFRYKKNKLILNNVIATSFENGLRTKSVKYGINKTRKLISKIGILNNLSKINVTGLKTYTINSANPTKSKVPQSHYGKGLTSNQNKLSCIMEGIERYVVKLPLNNSKLIYSDYKSIETQAIHPKKFAFPIGHTFNDNKKISWIKGFCLNDGIEYYIPTELVTFAKLSKNHIYGMQTSNGLASGFCKEEAILQALMEVIERDGLFISELNCINSPDVLVKENNLPKNISDLIKLIKSKNINLYIKKLTSDINIPNFGVFFKGKIKGLNCYSYAPGCHLNKNIALSRALTEAIQLYPHFEFNSQWINKRPIKHLYEKSSTIINYDDIKSYENPNIKENIFKTINILGKRKIKVFAIDLTDKDIKVPVVRVVATDLQPSYFFKNYIEFPRISKRVFDVPYNLGYFSKRRNINELTLTGNLIGYK